MTVTAQIGAAIEAAALDAADQLARVLENDAPQQATHRLGCAVNRLAEALALFGVPPEQILAHVGEGYLRGAWQVDPAVDTAALERLFGR